MKVFFTICCLFVSYISNVQSIEYSLQNKSLSIVYAADNAPISFQEKSGKASGLLIDYWRLWGKKNKVSLRFITQENQALHKHVIPLNRLVIHSGERADQIANKQVKLDFYREDFYLFHHKAKQPVMSAKPVLPYQIGIVAGYSDLYLNQDTKSSESIRIYDNLSELYHAAINGEIDAFVSPLANWYYYSNQLQMLDSFYTSTKVPIFSLYYSVSIDQKSSIDYLQLKNSLEIISETEKQLLLNKWPIPNLPLKKKKYTIAAVLNNAPLSMINSYGEPAGLYIDIWRLWAKKSKVDISFLFSPHQQSLQNVLEKKADFHSGTHISEPWQTKANKIYQLDAQLYGRLDVDIQDDNDFQGKEIAVISPRYGARLQQKYSNIKIKVANDLDQLMLWVNRGEISLFFHDQVVIEDKLTRLGVLGNFRSFSRFQFRTPIYASTSEQSQHLDTQITAGLKAIYKAQLYDIEKQWLNGKSSTYFHNPNELGLTDKEQKWIEEHQNIIFAFDDSYFPYSFKNSSGVFEGIAVDISKELAQRAGLNVSISRYGDWNKIYNKATDKNIDVIATLVQKSEREAAFNFTSPYISLAQYIITHIDNDNIVNKTDLSGKKIALVKGYPVTDLIIKENPSITPLYVSSMSEALLAVANKEADVLISSFGVMQGMIDKMQLTELKFVTLYSQGGAEQSFAVREDWPELASILQKALDSFSKEELLQYFKRWTSEEVAKIESITSEPVLINELTIEERRFLNNSESIDVGVMNNWAPVEYLDSSGRAKGLSINLLNALNRRLSGKISIKSATWPENFAAVKNKKLDALMSFSYLKNREKFFNATLPYVTIPEVLVHKKIEFFQSLEDLTGKTLALEEGIALVSVMQDKYPEINLLIVKSTSDALYNVAQGKADAYIGNFATALYTIDKQGLTNLKIGNKLHALKNSFAIGVRKDKPQLVQILQKTLDSLTKDEWDNIFKDWGEHNEENVRLTVEERDYLKEHPIIRMGYDNNWHPIESLNDQGEYIGLSANYIDRIAEILSIKIEPVLDRTWGEMLKGIKEGEVDLMPAISRTHVRDKFVDFTEPYIQFPVVIVTRDDHSYIADIASLNGKNVSIVKGYISADYISLNYPDIKLNLVSDISEGLSAVSNGVSIAFIGTLPMIGDVITREGHSNLKVSGELPQSSKVRMGVAKGNHLLLSIIEKALKKISKEERASIKQRWFNISYDHAFDYWLLLQILTPIVLLLLFFYLWNRVLKNKVENRTHDLLYSREKYKELIEHMPIGIIVTNMQGIIEQVNDKTLELFNDFDRNNFIGKFTKPRFVDESKRDELRKSALKTKFHNDEVYFKRKGKAPFWGGVTSILQDSDKENPYFLNILQDISDQKLARTELEDLVRQRTVDLELAKQVAEAATETKSQFLANMSHEIRTPINAILGLLFLVQKTPLGSEQANYIKKSERATKSLLGLINDILDLSKIEAGKLSVESREFDIHELVNNVFDLFHEQAEQKNLHLIIDIAPTFPRYLIGDALRITQILTNYLSNALKFTEQGRIVLQLSILNFKYDKPLIQFSVKDTGIGLSKEQQNKLFYKFSQADQSITRQYGGTGLGLAINLELAKIMHGDCWIEESELGKGSTFNFTARLGIAQTEQNRYLQKIELTIEQQKQTTVTIVQADAILNEVLASTLSELNVKYHIFTDVNGMSDYAQHNAESIGVILIDWSFEHHDIDTLVNVLSTNKQSKIAIMSSAKDTQLERFLALNEHLYYLQRPFIYTELVNLICSMHSLQSPFLKQDASLAKDSEASAILINKKILLVEDNTINQEVAVALLNSIGLKHIDIANNGVEGLKFCKANQYDLILMDIQMPIMNGLECAQSIRKLEKELNIKETPIIAMTAQAMKGDQARTREVGMNDYISKPINPDKFGGKIKEWLEIDISQQIFSKNLVLKESLISRPSQFINFKDGLMRLVGNEALYQKQLDNFKVEYADAPQKLQTLLAENSHYLASMFTHELKGVTGNLGMTALFELSTQINDLLMLNQKISKQIIDEFSVTLNATFSAIKLFKFKTITAPEMVDIPTSQVLEKLKLLQRVIIDDVSEAFEIINDMSDSYQNSNMGNKLKQLQDCFDNFEIDEAQVLLIGLIDQFEKEVESNGKEQSNDINS